MAAAKRKFTLPSVEDFDEEKQIPRTKSLFKASKTSNGDSCARLEETATRTTTADRSTNAVSSKQNDGRLVGSKSSKPNIAIKECESTHPKDLTTNSVGATLLSCAKDVRLGSSNGSRSANQIKGTTGSSIASRSDNQIKGSTGSSDASRSANHITCTTGSSDAYRSANQITGTTGSSDVSKSANQITGTTGSLGASKSSNQITGTTGSSDVSKSANQITGTTGSLDAFKSANQVTDTTSSSSNPVVGKTFRQTFAFLEGTSHYKETVAKIKEIEASKPGRESAPSTSSRSKTNAIIVSPRQKGNPILKHVRNVPWELGDIVPDYELGATACALFLSLRYHNFNPEYIHERLKQLGQRYELRILLVLVDVKDPHQTLRDLAKMAVMADCTLILSWSPEEAGRYLETYKVYENKPPDALLGQSEGDYFTKFTECLTTLKGINKTDCISLSSTFGCLANVAKVSKEDLAFLPGFGPLKAQRLHDLLNEPFVAKKKETEDLSKGEGTSSRTNSGL